MILRRLYSTSYRLPPTIRQLLAAQNINGDSTTTVTGYVKSIRRQKNLSFAVITDGSSVNGIQAVLLDGAGKGLTNGTSVRLTGKLVPSPGKGQDKELVVQGEGEGVVILGECDPQTYPIQKQALSSEYLRDHAHLRARTDGIAAMIRLRNRLRRGIGTFFEDQGFCYTDTPILTGNDAEGAGEAFSIAKMHGAHPAASPSTSPSSDPTPTPPTTTTKSTADTPHTGSQNEHEFFSRPAFLTVSHQLHLEALATALSRVYTLSPCFRAERSLTGRHLAEFWMLEAEWGFGRPNEGVHDVCSFVESCLKGVASHLVGNGKLHASGTGRGLDSDDMEVLWKDGDERKRRALEGALRGDRPWTRMSYTEAVKELESHLAASPLAFKYEPRWGRALQSEHERWLAETLVGGPVFVTDYPAALKPFYMRMNEDGRTVACFDLLVPHVGELVGGSVREERVDVLERKMESAGGPAWMEEYRWYLDLRRYGGAPHAGFGMGFERLVGWVSGIENIRECVPMPRWSGRMLL